MEHGSRFLLAATLVLMTGTASASELVYTPRNPSFGGNPLYGSHLLGVASAINDYKDPVAEADKRKRELEQAAREGNEFERIIRSSLMSQISRQVSDQIYGENAVESGSFILGETRVDFRQDGGNTIVDIFDPANGGSTTISIPTPQF